jgi:hypothetical protein
MINNEEVLGVQVNIQVIDFIKSLCWLGDFAPIPVLLLRDFFLRGIRVYLARRPGAGVRERGSSGVEELPGLTVLCCARRGKFFASARQEISGRGVERKYEVGLGLWEGLAREDGGEGVDKEMGRPVAGHPSGPKQPRNTCDPRDL